MRRLTAILLASVFAAAHAIAQDEGGGRAAVPTAIIPRPRSSPTKTTATLSPDIWRLR